MKKVSSVQQLIQFLTKVREEMLSKEKAHQEILDHVHTSYRESARNLLHYLTLRTTDLRPVQEKLSTLGISSLGHSERYALANLSNALYHLHLLAGTPKNELEAMGLSFYSGFPRSRRRLNKHTNQLFGPEKWKDHTRIMVTLPSDASTDYDLVEALLAQGVEIVRINCSHDDEEHWAKMIWNVHKAERTLNTHCLIYMDLPGPKLRTGPTKKGKKNKKAGISLSQGEVLYLYREPVKGTSAKKDRPAQISTTLPEIFNFLKPGESIWFDDGKIGGLIEAVDEEKALVRIHHAPLLGGVLRANKGINLPDTTLNLPSLTQKDQKILPFIARHAHMVGYSFVQSAEDVRFLQEKLASLDRIDLGIILKIETKKSFRHLPELLLQAMQNPKVGVMIARGDLAIEMGWERIAEVQEQIAWLCEAAHIPYIWATQVLENLAKTGQATRAEITDAAMAVRAECAMLNKGPFILEAVKTLQDLDQRMDAHHYKKMASLRPLQVAVRFWDKN
ncbi:MAG: pyruvate kinase [Saprospiraceae bacterium]|nr:pyruvate kinase [Saprospiraceae bacterium]